MAHRFPLITAHSGSMGTIDHTVPSIETVIRLGADVVEEDIRVTKDGILVLAHDDEWAAEDGSKWSISQTTYNELKDLRFEAVNGERRELIQICRLDEILPLVKVSGRIINLDLKVDESIAPVAALVEQFGMAGQVILSGCEADRAMLAQQQAPELRKLLNADINLFRTLSYQEAMEKTCEDALAASCFGINIYFKAVTQEFMDYTASKGLPVYVWTVNEEELMRDFADLGVASITTRNVAALVQLKQELSGSVHD